MSSPAAREAPVQVRIGEAVFEAHAGDRLIDLCDWHATALRFSCRAGSCGTCEVRVLEGLDHLSVPTENERIVLSHRQGDSAFRLACQMTVLGPVRLEPAAPPDAGAPA